MNRKELLVNYIQRLVVEFGYTKKQIADKIGLPATKLTNVLKAKRMDERLLALLIEHFPELQQPPGGVYQKKDQKKDLNYLKYNRKELLKKNIERLVNEFGYTKRQIAKIMNVPPTKVSNVTKAIRLDENFLQALLDNFPELQLPVADVQDPSTWKAQIDYAEQEYQRIANDPDLVKYMGSQFEELKKEVEKLRKMLEGKENK
jgi:predicted transcriptional regulator